MLTLSKHAWLGAAFWLLGCTLVMGQESMECEGDCYEDPGCCQPALLGFILPTDPTWAGFISPMTNPVFFEDPRTLTEARFIFIDHEIPTLAGGAIPASRLQVIAVQLRAALTEDLSLIATKDGFIFPTAGAPLDDGWADVSLGLKYNLWKDCCCLRILSVGATYELPVGSTQALQGNGDGEFNLFGSYGALFGDCNHLLTTLGIRLPTDRSEENQVFYWSAHVDRQLCGTCWYGFLEGTWYHWLSNGDNAAFAGIQGGDLFNFGATGVAGTDIVTGALGVKYKPSLLNEVGLAYELPLTDERGVLQHRLTVDYILRY